MMNDAVLSQLDNGLFSTSDSFSKTQEWMLIKRHPLQQQEALCRY